MSIHIFQISVLNSNLFNGGSFNLNGPYTSEFPQQPDNINGQLARYYGIMGVWSDVAIGIGLSQIHSWQGSYGMPTGFSGTGDASNPYRPEGGYYVRGVFFADNAFPGAVGTDNGFRCGYYGSFQSGLWSTLFAHDPSNLSVDYETLYGHGTRYTWPMTSSLGLIASQFLDSNNITTDTGLTCTNESSVYTRTQYMPPSTFLLHCANNPTGAATLGSGNAKFFLEHRPSLRAAGFDDGNPRIDSSNVSISGSANTNTASRGCWDTDPRRGQGSSLANPSEYFQISGVRKLNSRGLSFHVAKVFDNTRQAYGYLWEEDGQTVQPSVPCNVQTEYIWQRGQDYVISATQVTSNVATFTCANPSFPTGTQLTLSGFTSHQEFNGQMVTVLPGSTALQFQANWNHPDYGVTGEIVSTVASVNQDIRIRQAAYFQISEEYYGFVMDTKCTIWSNKTSMIPLVFFDLADTWTASLAPRIGGVAVTGVNQNPITNVSETSGSVLTITCNNNYVAGQKVYIQNLGNATYLNSQTLTILTATPLQFTANDPTVHGAYGPTAEKFGSAGGYKVWFLSEDGILAVYDFTTALTDALSLVGNNAPVPSPTPVVTVPPTPPVNCYGAMQASADGSTLYAIYGHMAVDPRLTTTSASSPTVGVLKYNVGAGTWGSVSSIPNPARHNGRSLNEMIVLRDGRIALMCESVDYVGTSVKNKLAPSGTPPLPQNVLWQVAIYDGVSTWNTAVIDGREPSLSSPLTATITQSTGSGYPSTTVTYTVNTMTTPFPVGSIVTISNLNGSATVGVGGQAYTVLASPAPTTTQFSVSVPNLNYNSTQSDSGTATQGIQYGTNFSAVGNNQVYDWWFQISNAFLHDVGTNKLLIQSNWTAGGLWALDISVSTASTSNSNLSLVSSHTLWSYGNAGGYAGGSDPFVPQNSTGYPARSPVSITHARAGVTNADRTLVTVHQLLQTSSSNQPVVYLAPPSFDWMSPSLLQLTYNNYYNPGFIANGFDKDFWSVEDLTAPLGGGQQNTYWTFPTMLMDNYVHFVRCAGTADTGYNGSFVYGRSAAQTIGYLPTYFKWTDSAWAMADNFTDGYSNPYTIPGGSFSTPISLPYGLQVSFGPSGSDSWTSQGVGGHGEFFTFNVAWGNTKFARKSRNTWAMFAGQTFLTTESHPLTDMTAMKMSLIDTDQALVTFTAPTNLVGGASATLTQSSGTLNGWSTGATWPKLDVSHNAFDATPLVMNIHAATGSTPGQALFDPTTCVYAPPQAAPSPDTATSSVWTVGSTTYTVTADSTQNFPSSGWHPWYAFTGNHSVYWRSNVGGSGTIGIDTGSVQTVNGYSFRPYYDNNNTLTGAPHSWTFEGSPNGSSWTILDTQANFTAYQRGVGFKLSSPATTFRYFRLVITSTNDNTPPTLTMFQMYSAVPSGTFNFQDICLMNFGNNNTAGVTQNNPVYLMLAGMARGLKFEVSTNNGGSYTPITPLWRSHMGYVYCFNRQTGITDLHVTCQQGYNVSTGNFASGTDIPATAGFGPLYMWDYGAGITSARLGSASALDATPPRGSYDTQCLGVAGDAISISLDSGSPSAWQPMYNVPTGSGGTVVNNYGPYSQLYGFWDTTQVFGNSSTSSGYFKIHPFFGFILFQGAGPSNGASGDGGGVYPTLTGTTLGLTYNWGRRV